MLKRSTIPAVAALLVISGACAKAEAMKRPPSDAIRIEALMDQEFSKLSDLKKASIIAIVRVASESEQPGDVGQGPPDEPKEVVRVLELEVERVLKGRIQPGAQLANQNLGWFVDGEGKRPYMYDDGTWMQVGDRALVALRGDGKNARRSPLLTYDAAFFLKDGEVQDTPRKKQIIRELEALSEAELIERFQREAAS